jgi:hypothetical protein
MWVWEEARSRPQKMSTNPKMHPKKTVCNGCYKSRGLRKVQERLMLTTTSKFFVRQNCKQNHVFPIVGWGCTLMLLSISPDKVGQHYGPRSVGAGPKLGVPITKPAPGWITESLPRLQTPQQLQMPAPRHLLALQTSPSVLQTR